MGDKYIIELEDKPFHKENGDFLYRVKGFNSLVFDMTGIGKLTPYNSPDLEQVKADAYLKGLNDGQGVILESTQNNAFDNGYKKCLEDMEHDKGKENSIGYKIGYKKGYVDGLNRISDYEDKIRKEAYQKGYETGYEDGYNKPGKNQQEAYQRGLSDAWEAAKKLWDLKGEMIKAFRKYSVFDILNCYTASEAIEKIRQYEHEQEEFHVGDEFENENGKTFVVLKMNGKEIDRYIDEDGSTYHMNVKYKVMRKTGRHFPEVAALLEKMRGEQDG